MSQSVAEVIAQWRNDPNKNDLIQNLYYGVDVWNSALRFQSSPEFQAVLRIAKEHQKAMGVVLDIGGGNGVATLAWHNAGYEATLLEPDASDIVGIGALAPVLQERDINTVSIYEGMAEETTFADNTFDIVYCRQVLHHIRDLPALTKEVRRILKPDGVFIATREHVITEHSDLEIFLENHDLHSLTGGEHAYLETEYLEALNNEFSSITVIRYYDSVINYFPMTERDFDGVIKKELCKFSLLRHLHVCGLLSKLPIVREWTINRLNENNHLPGRMYSFVAS